MWGFGWVSRINLGGHGSSGGKAPAIKNQATAAVLAVIVVAAIIYGLHDMHNHPSQGYLPPGCHWIADGPSAKVPDCPSYHTPLPSEPVVTLPPQPQATLPPAIPTPPLPQTPSTTTPKSSSTSTTLPPQNLTVPAGCTLHLNGSGNGGTWQMTC